MIWGPVKESSKGDAKVLSRIVDWTKGRRTPQNPRRNPGRRWLGKKEKKKGTGRHGWYRPGKSTFIRHKGEKVPVRCTDEAFVKRRGQFHFPECEKGGSNPDERGLFSKEKERAYQRALGGTVRCSGNKRGECPIRGKN